MEQRWARLWFAATAVVVLVALVIQLLVTGSAGDGHFATPATRTLNVLVFFTIQSNILVGATSLVLALAPYRRSTAFAVLRLSGVVAIAITGVVYHTLLRGLAVLTAWGTVADVLLHSVVPVLAVFGWVAFGPRGRTSVRIATLALVFPVAWLVFTLLRGPLVDWYPYPFVDVAELGYPRVLVNVAGISLLFLLVAYGAHAADRLLTTRRPLAGEGAEP
ncbi:MAG TPA: Pr6Pr family membrane protein [Pseudonocardiaceae bacterium]